MFFMSLAQRLMLAGALAAVAALMAAWAITA